MFTTKLARFAAMCVGCAIVVTNSNPSFAQSTDRDNPAVVITSIDPKSRSDKPKSFAQWCQEKDSVSPSRKLTIDLKPLTGLRKLKQVSGSIPLFN